MANSYLDQSGVSALWAKIKSKFAQKTTTTTTLSSTGWSGNSQTVTVNGITSTVDVVVSPDPTSASVYSQCGVLCTGQGSGSLTFECETAPSTDLIVNVMNLG